ncbi:MAG: DUF835 domain-containing protein [Nanoarchaeota archaeon]|nr:DUF835 domain-containing protein [Nanoarchaeota archaeon]
MKNLNLSAEIKSSKTALMLIPGLEYNDVIIKTLKQLSGKSVCYITLNKTFDALKELFKKNHIDTDNVVFVDAISKTIKKAPAQTDQCYFVSSPSALTELSLVISKFLKHNFEYIIFDSITNLMIYENKDSVAKFISHLVNKTEASKTRAIFYALKTGEHQTLIDQVGMFVDKVINLNE